MMAAMQNRHDVAKEYVRRITVKGWEQRANIPQSILTITAVGTNGKKITLKTNGRMKVQEIIDMLVEGIR